MVATRKVQDAGWGHLGHVIQAWRLRDSILEGMMSWGSLKDGEDCHGEGGMHWGSVLSRGTLT